MRRRRTDPVLQQLQQLSRRGCRSEALQLLQNTLREKPNHLQAREELTRHLTGRPYSFEEKGLIALRELLSDEHSAPAVLNAASRSRLRSMRKRLYQLEMQHHHLLLGQEADKLQMVQERLSREFSRRRRPMKRFLRLCAAGTVLLLAAASGLYFLWLRAGHAAATMRRAHSPLTPVETAQALLRQHNTGLNRTFSADVRLEADRLEAHLRAADKRAQELDAILRSIESGEQSVVGQGVRRRAEIERMLQLPCRNASAFHRRWAGLCQAEKDALNQQRLALSEEIMAPLSPMDALCGKIPADIATLENRCAQLRQRILLYEDAGETLGLPADIISPVLAELESATRLLQEVKELQQVLHLLPTAHDYAGYCKLLAGARAEHYAPGIDLLSIREQMPQEDSVRGMMQEHGQNLRPGLLQAARTSLLEGGASFSQDIPATRKQLLLLQELLTNSALHTRLYELTDTAENQRAFAEHLPELRYGRACFERSALDPARQANGKKAEEWHNPRAILSREIDPRPLHTGLGLDNRSGFLSTVNIPNLLTRTFQIEGTRIPALARAYVFHHLVQVNEAAAEPMLTGLRYAPTMRQLIAEFQELQQACGVKLDGNCWLLSDPQHLAAERRFARWFDRNRKVDFTGEIRRNLETLFRITPRFCGYVNEQGEAILFEPARQGQLIWYMGADAAMTTTPWGEAMQQARPLSPVFTMEKEL